MRAFVEAKTVDERYRKIWWEMRAHHIDRFIHALGKYHNITEVNSIDIRIITEAMASMVEQSAYCWYAQEELHTDPPSLDIAAKTITTIWYRAIFD